MFCRHCGNEVNDNAVVCNKCGCSVKETIAKPKVEINVFTIISLILGIGLYICNVFLWAAIYSYTIAYGAYILLYVLKSASVILSVVGVYKSKDKQDHLLAWITLTLNALTLFI